MPGMWCRAQARRLGFGAVVMATTLMAARPASPQIAKPVFDACTGTTHGSDPFAMTRVGSQALFFAYDDRELALWRTDGTPGATTRVMAPGSDVRGVLGVVDGMMVFWAIGTGPNLELWRSDGTGPGTTIYFVEPMPADPIVASAELDGVIYFIVRAPDLGWELWRTDATSAGRVARIGEEATYPADLFLVASASRLYLAGDDGVHGVELWTSDGTAQGTRMVADLLPGREGSKPRATQDAVVGERVFFVAARATDVPLWVSDGTAAGTRVVRAFKDATNWYTAPTMLTAHRGVLLFVTSDGVGKSGLWRSDGTSEGTSFVSGQIAFSRILGEVGDALITTGASPANALFRTDGTTEGTSKICDLGATSRGLDLGAGSVSDGGRVFFGAGESSTEIEPWLTDGTAAGTGQFADIVPEGAAGGASFGVSLGSRIVFSAQDGVHGAEPWVTDGTSSGTRLLDDLNLANDSSAPFALTDVNGTVFYVASDCRYGSALWRSDGTRAGTVMVRAVAILGSGAANGNALEPGDGKVYFVADDGVSGTEIWVSDGTEAGTHVFVELRPGPGSSEPLGLLWYRGALCFVATDASGRRGLWRSDGTPEGTTLLYDGDPTYGSPYAGWMINAGARIFFIVNDPFGGQLWTSDGTAAGTSLVRAADGGTWTNGGMARATVLNGKLLFIARDSVHGWEIWISDGTPDGTHMVADVMASELRDFPPTSPTIIHGRLVFNANDGLHGWELWQTDGTAAGTSMIADIGPGPEGSWPINYGEYLEGPGNTFYFTAFETEHGRQLWVSDFTPAGTHMVAELLPQPFAPLVLHGKTLGDSLVFSLVPVLPGCDCPFDPELWVTQGTAETTRRIEGVRPPDLRAMFSLFEPSHGCLMFEGFDTLSGWELRQLCDGLVRRPRRSLSARP